MENKKTIIALALVALVGIVGATFAYFTSTAKLTNEFVTGTYSTSVTEEFVSPDNWTPGTTTTKKVNVTNNGSVDVAVRATYTEKWTAANKTTVLSNFRNGEKVALFTIGSNWEKGTDGWYYYKQTLGKNATSTDFISSVTFNPNFELEEGTDIECKESTVNGKTTVNCTSLTSGYAGATYSLDITIETIQADQKWNYDIPTMISFSIDGVSYQAEEGMTWADWAESDYSVGRFDVYSGYVVSNGTSIIGVNSTGVIVANNQYKLSSNPLPF